MRSRSQTPGAWDWLFSWCLVYFPTRGTRQRPQWKQGLDARMPAGRRVFLKVRKRRGELVFSYFSPFFGCHRPAVAPCQPAFNPAASSPLSHGIGLDQLLMSSRICSRWDSGGFLVMQSAQCKNNPAFAKGARQRVSGWTAQPPEPVGSSSNCDCSLRLFLLY